MNPGRILYGMDRPPRGIAWDHPRLPGVIPGPGPLRLNTLAVAPAYLPAGIERAGRRAAVQEWLELACGDYAAARVRFVAGYLAAIDAEVQDSRSELQDRLFGGLFEIEDWTWSALRPLPRAWISTPGGPLSADFMFWNGRNVTAVSLGETVHADALHAAGVTVLNGASPEQLPDRFRHAWRGETLPSSPFRRPVGTL